MRAAPAPALASLACLFALVACGGSGGGTSAPPPPPPPPPPAPALLEVSIAGGASPGIAHLWVTVTGVALNTDVTKEYDPTDASWLSVPLPAPVTLDLAAGPLALGTAQQIVKASTSALGSYGQLRLLVASPDPGAALSASAAALGLAWNDEVQYTDAAGTHSVPLEIPEPLLAGGLRASTAFALNPGVTTPLSLEWNAATSLVHRTAGFGGDRFTVRNELELYNQQLLTALGGDSLTINGQIWDAVTGQLSTAQFCPGAPASGCIHDVVASATLLAADGRYHREVRSVNVGADGSFTIYPLPSESVYDIVIRGANMQTVVVRNVFVDPTGLLRSIPTALSSAAHPIVPVLDTSGPSLALSQALQPASSRLYAGQTVAGSGGTAGDVPYIVAATNADPLTGQIAGPLALPGGPMQVAVFNAQTDGNGTPPAFSAVIPAEGAGAHSVWATGTGLDATGPALVVAASATTVAVPVPPLQSAFSAATLTVTITGTPSNGADQGELIVADDSGIVADLDVSALVATGGVLPVSLWTGSLAAAPGATVYGVALRTWKAGAEATTTAWRRAPAPVDMSATATAALSIALP